MSREQRRRYEIVDRRSEKHMSGGSRQSLKVPPGLGFWQPRKAGTYRIEVIPFVVTKAHNRFLPDLQFSEVGKVYYERTFWVHSGIGVNNESYTCPAKTMGQRCSICEARARLTKSPHKEDEDRAFQLKPKERQLFLVMERNDRGELSGELKLWELSNWCFGRQLDDWLAAAEPEDRPGFQRFYDPYDGYTLKLHASEESMGAGGNKYLKFSVHEMRPRKEELDTDLLEHGYDLDEMVRVLDYEALRRVFHGVDEDGEDEASSSPPPPAASRSRLAPPPSTSNGKEEVGVASRDRVSFYSEGNKLEGIVEKVDEAKGIVEVKVKGKVHPYKVFLDDVKVLERDTMWDQIPDEAPRRSQEDEEDEEEVSPPPPRKKK